MHPTNIEKDQAQMTPNPLQDRIDWVSEKHGSEVWITVYQNSRNATGSEDFGLYCALATQGATTRAMNQSCWDLMIGTGGPGFMTRYQDGKEISEYYTDLDNEYKRIVRCRDFYGRKKDYIEIMEEFRLFHNLYYEPKSNTYLAFDDSGDEIEVVKMTQNEIKIKKSYLNAFAAALQMNIFLYFEFTRHFENEQTYAHEYKSDSLRYSCFSGDSYLGGHKSFTRTLGKKLITCGDLESCGIWPFEKAKKYEEFIIGGDEDSPVVFSSNPDDLANYFGANPGAPNYLTPVFFKKEVMLKYYNSSEYEISDGYLHRLGAWGLRFDNNSPDHIAVFLGDLGKDLPSKEQLYWKSYNIFPDGRKISRTNFERSFMGNFYTPENPEHQFKYLFTKLQESWHKQFGWFIFLPLQSKDEHFFNSVRSMLTNEQSEFDAMILAVAKITIDSINVKELRVFLHSVDNELKSIELIARTMTKLSVGNSENHIKLLRAVQSIRSAGVAHRKGSEYEKAMTKFTINKDDYQQGFDAILSNYVSFFKDLMHATELA